MSKRRISHQQQKRIQARQARHVQDAETQQLSNDFIDENSENSNDSNATDLQQGLVIANLGKTALIESIDGSVIFCHSRQHLETLVPGDRVLWQQGEQSEQQEERDQSVALLNNEMKAGHVVVAVKPRRSTLMRYSARGDIKPMAANLDQLIIVFASQPAPHWSLIDSYLVLAQHLQLQPILLLNKLDLGVTDDVTKIQCAVYQQLGYRLLSVSAKTGVGLATLEETLLGHVSIFVGQSGVGKSALSRFFLPDEKILVAAEEKETVVRLGKHTTTTARLYHLPGGGDVIDSPGVRVVHTIGMSTADITQGFKEIAAAAQHCQFRNCQHLQEPGCAVQAALAKGDVNARRYQSYCTMVAEANR